MSAEPTEPVVTTEVKTSTRGMVDGSILLGVAISGWLALILTITVCGIVTTNMILAALGYTSVYVTIPEPLYSGFIAALAFYLGLNKKQA